MSMVLCCWGSMMENGIKNGLTALSADVSEFHRELSDYDTDTDYLNALDSFLKTHPETESMMSVNYVPLIAMVCKAHKLPAYMQG